MNELQRLDFLRGVRWSQAAEVASKPLVFKRPHSTQGDFVPLFATGGIGDLTVSLGVAASIAEKTCLPVHMWTPYPNVAQLLLEHWVGDAPQVYVQTEPFPGFEYWIRCNSLAFFEFQPGFRRFDRPRVADLYTDSLQFRGGLWEHIVRFHPRLDGAAAEQAIKDGIRRHELPFRMLGLEPNDYRLMRSNIEMFIPKEHTQRLHSYLTVHDGYDKTQRAMARATKTWHLGSWERVVRDVKRDLGLKVVQIGGPTSRRIPGVDVDLVGKTTVMEALGVLAGSACHVDGDSGFVHAAYRLNVPSVAMFGPTPKEFFGYRNHSNISAEPCGGCFWMTDTWLERCAVGHPTPACMDRINPAVVLTAVRSQLGL